MIPAWGNVVTFRDSGSSDGDLNPKGSRDGSELDEFLAELQVGAGTPGRSARREGERRRAARERRVRERWGPLFYPRRLAARLRRSGPFTRVRLEELRARLAIEFPGRDGVIFRKRNKARTAPYVERKYAALMARQRRQNMVVWLLGGLVLAALAAVYWIAFPQVARDATMFFAGAAAATALWLWDFAPPWIEKYRLGTEGERATRKILEGLKGDGWHVVHDIPFRHGNFDHVLVGPGGVVLVDSKRRRGRLRVEGEALVARYSDDPLEEYTDRGLGRRARRAAAELRELLSERGVSWVTSVVAVHGELAPSVVDLRDVTIVRGDRLADWIRGLPERLPPAAVEPIARELAALAGEDPAPQSSRDSVGALS